MQDVSIEYAHIYTNQHIDEEHQTSLDILNELKLSLSNNATSSLVVMVDDYSFPDPTFNYADFTAWLKRQGHEPGLLIRESQLIPACDEVLALIQDVALRQHITDYIKSKKYPCSLFIAAWYLSRLGKIENPVVPPSVRAKRLINILPESFKPFEDKGLEIIASTPYKECVDLIEYRFLPGRLIA
jgi:hypothetical protein